MDRKTRRRFRICFAKIESHMMLPPCITGDMETDQAHWILSKEFKELTKHLPLKCYKQSIEAAKLFLPQ